MQWKIAAGDGRVGSGVLGGVMTRANFPERRLQTRFSAWFAVFVAACISGSADMRGAFMDAARF